MARVLALLVAALSVAPLSLAAQVIPDPIPVSPTAGPQQVAPLPAPLAISPRGAFLRALAFPGWGHAAIGSHARGGFYFAAQTATLYTLARARTRIGTAESRVRFRENILTAQLAADGVTDPVAVDEALTADAELAEVERLLESRKEQQEDLIALSLFVLLLSGADAYVSAHLARFPDPLELEARPSNVGTLDLGLRVKLPN
jgi:hypothetical protein